EAFRASGPRRPTQPGTDAHSDRAVREHARNLTSYLFCSSRALELAIRAPRFPQRGTLIHFHEFKGFAENRRTANHLAKCQGIDIEAKYGHQMRRVCFQKGIRA